MADDPERQMAQAFAALPFGAAILDSGFSVRLANDEFRRIMGPDLPSLPRLPAFTPFAGAGEWREDNVTAADGTTRRLRSRLDRLDSGSTTAAWLLMVEETAPAPQHLADAESRLNAARTRFLTGSGHDLRQPLNALSLFLGVLKATKTHDRALEIAGRMQGTLETVVALFNGIHLLAKLETGAVEVHPETVEAGRLIETLLTEFEQAADAKGLAFRAVPCAGLLHTDADVLLIVLRAFVANAIAHTQQGSVLVGCRRRSASVRIDVIDSGPGLPAGGTATLFEDFQRGRNTGQGSGGYGLGLGTAARAARLIGSPIEAAPAPGGGARFSVYVASAAA